MRFISEVKFPAIVMAASIAALLSGCQQTPPAAPEQKKEINLLGNLETRSTTIVSTTETNGVLVNTLGMRMVAVQPGTFHMGSPMNEPGRQEDEYRHEVRLTKRYYICTTEVTQAQWMKVKRTEPWRGQKGVAEGRDQPATHVSYEDAVQFCVLLSQMENATYRLPTEAEWEAACRFGGDGAYHGDTLSEIAWTDATASLNHAMPVAKKKANALGLYDMHGNVAEWCADWYGNYPRGGAATTDPTGPATGEYRIVRGGAWDSVPRFCRSAYRTGMDAQTRSSAVGFRVVLVK